MLQQFDANTDKKKRSNDVVPGEESFSEEEENLKQQPRNKIRLRSRNPAIDEWLEGENSDNYDDLENFITDVIE
jgi:hypothetical protein